MHHALATATAVRIGMSGLPPVLQVCTRSSVAGSFVCRLGAIRVGVMTFTGPGPTSRVTVVKVKSRRLDF